MNKVVEKHDIPKENLNDKIADYEFEGAVVSVIPQPDGRFTIRAVFKDDSQSSSEPKPNPPVEKKKSEPTVEPKSLLPTTKETAPKAAIELIKEFEGFSDKAYPDPITQWQLPTIGYGTTIYPDGTHVKRGDTITEARACECLADHVAKKCTPALTKIPTWTKMNSNQQSAFYSFAYNLGAGFYKGANFTSITHVCDSPEQWNDSAWIEEQFGKYTNHGLKGLVRRRKAEAKLFCTPT